TALFLHRTVRDGRAAGLAAVAGNEIGVFCWALAAGAGLTGLLRANRWLYLGLHVVGAVVFVYLGVSAWRSAQRQDGDAEFGAAFARRLPSGRTPAAAFRASLVTIAANPKPAVFAFSFFRSSCPGMARSSAPRWRWPPSSSSSTPATAWASCCSRPGPGAGCPEPRSAAGWNASWARHWSRSVSTWPPSPANAAADC
ncbi:MAG TPA: LysE family translocator, partial [Streptosporangiaceae bacterium]